MSGQRRLRSCVGVWVCQYCSQVIRGARHEDGAPSHNRYVERICLLNEDTYYHADSGHICRDCYGIWPDYIGPWFALRVRHLRHMRPNSLQWARITGAPKESA